MLQKKASLMKGWVRVVLILDMWISIYKSTGNYVNLAKMIVISSPLRSMNSPAIYSSVGLVSGISLHPLSGQDSNHTGIVYPKDMNTTLTILGIPYWDGPYCAWLALQPG